MALVVTVAGASSDSYATLVEADAFLAWRGSAAWSAAVDATKEGVLRAAVAVMDEELYKDGKSDSDQALHFPTTGTYKDGAYFVPDRVKRAQSYLAMYLLEDPNMLSGVEGVTKVSVPGGFDVQMAGGGDAGGLPNDVMDLLNRYLLKSGSVARVWNSARRGYL